MMTNEITDMAESVAAAAIDHAAEAVETLGEGVRNVDLSTAAVAVATPAAKMLASLSLRRVLALVLVTVIAAAGHRYLSSKRNTDAPK